MSNFAKRQEGQTPTITPAAALAKINERAQMVKLAALTLDPDIQVRVELDKKRVEELRIVLENGGKMKDAITVYQVAEKLLVVDGFHRVEAAKQAGRESIAAVIRQGTYEEALEAGEEANLHAQMPLTKEDRQRLYSRRMTREGHEWQQMSDGAIAAILMVDPKTIGNWRRKLESTMEISIVERTVVGKDGKLRNVSNIGPSPKKTLAAIGKIQTLCTLFYDKYAAAKAERGHPLMNDPDKGYDWCYQFRYPTFTLGDQEAAFREEYSALPVQLYQQFLRVVSKADFIKADIETWTDEEVATYTYAMSQQRPLHPNTVETFEQTRQTGMAQPKNPNLEYQPPTPTGRHRLTEVAATETETDPRPFSLGQWVKLVNKENTGKVKDTRWVDGGWQVLADIFMIDRWYWAKELTDAPHAETPATDDPYEGDEELREIVKVVDPAAYIPPVPNGYKPSNGTQTLMANNYASLMQLINRATEAIYAVHAFDFNLQYMQAPETLEGIADALWSMNNAASQVSEAGIQRLEQMAVTGLPYDARLAEQVAREGKARA